MFHLVSINKLTSLLIVDSYVKKRAENFYLKIKNSNKLMAWSFNKAEQSLTIMGRNPMILILCTPISIIDNILSHGIDFFEQRKSQLVKRVIHRHFKSDTGTSDALPNPHNYKIIINMYKFNMQELVVHKFMNPMLKRAGSVKQISSQAADIVVERIDGVLTKADEYMDQYLPGDPSMTDVDEVDATIMTSKAVRTIDHGARFSRKLQRRLTYRTLIEARALKHQGTLIIQVMKLIIQNPKMALRNFKQLWVLLSLPEPENQARPDTLEQLLTILTRESARRVVHFINAAASLILQTPRRLGFSLIAISHQLISVADILLRVTPFIRERHITNKQLSSLEKSIQKLNVSITLFLERAGTTGRPKSKKVVSKLNHNNHSINNRSLNGIE